MGRLTTAIENWVLAEYAFRLGPKAYSTKATDTILRAEEELREVLTGYRDLGRAGEALRPELKKRVQAITKPAPIPERKKTVLKERPTKARVPGLFDRHL